MRALISVYDKSGVSEFARGLVELGFEIVSSGGTGVALAEAGIAVTKVEDVTGFRNCSTAAKTLHPRIHAGILVRRGRDDDAAALSEHGIEPFDLVCVNLYPFELAVDRPELDETALIEMIDVGGPGVASGRRQELHVRHRRGTRPRLRHRARRVARRVARRPRSFGVGWR